MSSFSFIVLYRLSVLCIFVNNNLLLRRTAFICNTLHCLIERQFFKVSDLIHCGFYVYVHLLQLFFSRRSSFIVWSRRF